MKYNRRNRCYWRFNISYSFKVWIVTFQAWQKAYCLC